MPFIYYKEEMDARQSFVFFTAQALRKIAKNSAPFVHHYFGGALPLREKKRR
jgi:hypothetical protein